MHLSNVPAERDAATLFRMVAETLGTLLGATVQSQVTTLMYGTIAGSCNSDPICNSTLINSTGLDAFVPAKGQQLFTDNGYNHFSSTYRADNNTDAGRTYQSDAQWEIQKTFMVGAGAMGILCIILGAIVSTTVREQKTLPGKSVQRDPFCKGLHYVFKTKSYLILVMMFIWPWMSVAMFQANLILYLRFAVQLEEDFQYLMITLLCTTFLSMPVWFILMAKLGKKRIYIIGLTLLVPVMLVNYWLPNDFNVSYMHGVMAVLGFSIAAVYLIPAAMLPDVIDEATLRDGGVRREAMFFAYFVFCQKFGAGIAISISTASLEYFGSYKSGCCREFQDPAVEQTLRFICGPICASLIGLALICAYFYPLSTEDVKRNKALLAQLREGVIAEAPPDSNAKTSKALGRKASARPCPSLRFALPPLPKPHGACPVLGDFGSLVRAVSLVPSLIARHHCTHPWRACVRVCVRACVCICVCVRAHVVPMLCPCTASCRLFCCRLFHAGKGLSSGRHYPVTIPLAAKPLFFGRYNLLNKRVLCPPHACLLLSVRLRRQRGQRPFHQPSTSARCRTPHRLS